MTLSVQTEKPITFQSKGQPAFVLEGIIHAPTRVENAPIIILCHPQPASSDMNDPLIVALAHSIAETGMVALRFNFRGVGHSQGQPTDGRMEPLDLAGALDMALTQPGINPAKVCVVGHGFGAYTTLLYAPYDARIRTLVAVSVPLFRAQHGFPRQFERPKLFVTGEFDEICPRFKLEPFVEQMTGPKGIKVIVGARHLMRGYEEQAVQAIMKYITNWAQMSGV